MSNQLSAAEKRIAIQVGTYIDFCDRMGITEPMVRQRAEFLDGTIEDRRLAREANQAVRLINRGQQ
jgi:hypothetical protein